MAGEHLAGVGTVWLSGGSPGKDDRLGRRLGRPRSAEPWQADAVRGARRRLQRLKGPAMTADLMQRRITPADIPAAARLSAEPGWNQVPADWQLMIEHGDSFGRF